MFIKKNNMPNKTASIPKEWRQVKLDDVSVLLKGKGLAKNKLDPDGENKCILYGQLFTTYNEIINEVVSNTNYDEGTRSQIGDILIPGSTTTKAIDLAKASALLNSDVLLGGDINIIRKKNQDYDPIFLAYYLTHYKKREIESFGQGITIIHLYGRDIKKIKLILPPLLEQKKIADILSSVDEEIQKTDEIISQTEKLKQGLMRDIFSEKNYKKWAKVKLGDYVVIKSGDTPSNFNFEENATIPFYKVEDMNQSDKYLTASRYYFSIYNKTLMPKGMIVFPKRGAAIYTNKVRILTVNSYFDTNVMGLATKNGLNNEYLYYFLLNYGLSRLADTTSIPQINNKHIEPIEIFLPPIPIQKYLTTILASVDSKISQNKQQKEKMTQLKNGLMQDLLSGKVRVKV